MDTQYKIKNRWYIISVPHGSKLHITYHLPYSSCSTWAIQKSLTLNTKYLSLLEKIQENGPLTGKWWDRKSKRTRQKNKRRWEWVTAPLSALIYDIEPSLCYNKLTRGRTATDNKYRKQRILSYTLIRDNAWSKHSSYKIVVYCTLIPSNTLDARKFLALSALSHRSQLI